MLVCGAGMWYIPTECGMGWRVIVGTVCACVACVPHNGARHLIVLQSVWGWTVHFSWQLLSCALRQPAFMTALWTCKSTERVPHGACRVQLQSLATLMSVVVTFNIQMPKSRMSASGGKTLSATQQDTHVCQGSHQLTCSHKHAVYVTALHSACL